MHAHVELLALSPLDGRYANQIKNIQSVASEYALIQNRLYIEIQWLKTLANQDIITEIPVLSLEMQNILDNILLNFNIEEAVKIKKIEKKVKHDVKAIEYYLNEQLSSYPVFKPYQTFIHFGCTSDDINNIAYALMLKKMRQEHLIPILQQILSLLEEKALQYANIPLLSRTHGQAATPTTVGKEYANFAYRLKQQIYIFENIPIKAKWNGAVGNWNTHYYAYPEVDWIQLSQKFVESFNLQWNPYTTQIEPHDYIAEYMHALAHINTIFLDFVKDFWGYISLNYFKQTLNAQEVGSSTMPHKVNPIQFENAEGNLSFANALLYYFAQKLPISRWQRDLTDSTVMRNIGVGLGHSFLSYIQIYQAISSITVNTAVLEKDLQQHWEILAEPIQTIMRRYGIENAYEQLKDLSRGHTHLNEEVLHQWIDQLALPHGLKARLKTLRPETYLGKASHLAKEISEK